MIGLARVRIVVGKDSANSPVGLRSEGGVISLDRYRLVIVEYYQGDPSKDASVSM